MIIQNLSKLLFYILYRLKEVRFRKMKLLEKTTLIDCIVLHQFPTSKAFDPIPNLGCKSPPRHHSPKFRDPGHNFINSAGYNSGHNYSFALFTTTTYFTCKIEYVEQLKSAKFIVQSKNKKLQH